MQARMTLVLVLCSALPAPGQDEGLLVVKLYNGLEVRGQILRSDDREMVIRTWVGDKKVLRQDIVDFRKNLTEEERQAILRSINPWKDEREWRERDREFAAAAKVDTPKVEAPARRPEAAAPPHVDLNPLTNLRQPVRGVPTYATWEERMSAALDKRITMELADEPLDEALNFIATLTGLNVIVAPKVREKQLKVTLNVHNMDCGTAIKWITRLTDTHAIVKDQALFISDQPAKEDEDAERLEIMELLVRSGADIGLMPPAGAEITNDERTKIAMAIWEKTNPKPQDFPGPDLGLDPPQAQNPFGNP